jgi:Golgi SNAP receptor complex protein 2
MERQRPGNADQEDYYYKQQENSLKRSINQVDQYIEMGTESLYKLKQQGGALKNARRKMLDVANTLGLSSSTIRWIEKRTAEDQYIFWVGAIVTIIIMYFVYTWLR